MFSWLMRRLRWSRARRGDLRVLLYTREGCHLCTDAWDLLAHYQKLRGFTLEKVDVDTDVVLVSRFGTCVPVVTVNGVVRFRGRVNRVLFERILDAKE